MALINCPECGEKISSTSTQCVHCGCSIKICPECNEVYKGDIAECEKCGFRFVKSETTGESASKKNCIDAYNNWKSSGMNVVFHLSSVIAFCIVLLGAILAIVAVVKFDKWINAVGKDDIEALMNTSDVKDSIKTLFVFDFLLLAISEIYRVCSRLLGSQSLRKWFDDNGMDLSSSIKEYLSSNNFSIMTKQRLKGESAVIAKLIDAYMLGDIVYREKCRIRSIICCILNIGFSLLELIFLFENLKNVMQKVVIYGLNGLKELSWSDVTKWWMLIVSIVGTIIIGLCLDDNANRLMKKRNEFVKCNMADVYANYSNYLKIK